MMVRLIALMAAVMTPAQALAGASAAPGAFTTICTSAGPVRILLDESGRPSAPVRREASGCAHLWCQVRRKQAPAIRA